MKAKFEKCFLVGFRCCLNSEHRVLVDRQVLEIATLKSFCLKKKFLD